MTSSNNYSMEKIPQWIVTDSGNTVRPPPSLGWPPEPFWPCTWIVAVTSSCCTANGDEASGNTAQTVFDKGVGTVYSEESCQTKGPTLHIKLAFKKVQEKGPVPPWVDSNFYQQTGGWYTVSEKNSSVPRGKQSTGKRRGRPRK